MSQMRKKVHKLLRRFRTRTAVTVFEYALILSLISVVAIVVLEGIGGKTNNMVTSINSGFP